MLDFQHLNQSISVLMERHITWRCVCVFKELLHELKVFQIMLCGYSVNDAQVRGNKHIGREGDIRGPFSFVRVSKTFIPVQPCHYEHTHTHTPEHTTTHYTQRMEWQ